MFFSPPLKTSGTSPAYFLKKIHARNQGFYQIFEEENFLEELEAMKTFAKNATGAFDDIVVCGIGGSALGIITIAESCAKKNAPKLHVLENIDPDMISSALQRISLERTLFIFISKSGETIETLAQYEFFLEAMKRENCDPKTHSVIITGKSGYLYEQSKKEGITKFSVPENVGGRFSVLSSVGLLPALMLEIDVEEVLAGAREMVKIFTSEDSEKNLPFQLANLQFSANKPITVLMPYASRLRSLGMWYAQLLAESTGKNGKGFTMLPSVGPTDQHSQLQLFSEGPNDKLILFLEVEHFLENPTFSGNFLGSKKTFSFTELLHCERKGTQKSLEEKNIMTALISISSISEYEMGQLFLFFEGATAFLGEMMEINAFDQPGVERGKVLAKEMLLR